MPDGRLPAVAAVLLAAGRSMRMGTANKLLLDVAGQPMVATTLRQLLASGVAEVIVVTGYQAASVRAALSAVLTGDRRKPVRFVHNPDFDTGIAASIAAGLQAVHATTEGALVCLADMPLVDAAQVDVLLHAYAQSDGICVPVFEDKRGHPVLWPREFFAQMRLLRGDVGAREMLLEHRERVVRVPARNTGVLVDGDTPEALERFRAMAHACRGAGT